MRWVHYVAMIIVIVNLIWRLWYAFGSARRDYREFAITKRDITTAPKVILYYIFVKPSKPHLGKYNVMQKGTYILFVPLLIVQAFTGFSLLTQVIPVINMSPRELLVGWWLGAMLGSVDMAGWYMRTAHYLDQLALHHPDHDSRLPVGHRGLPGVPGLLRARLPRSGPR